MSKRPCEHHRHHAAGPIVNQYGVWPRRPAECGVEGCDREAKRRGLCVRHYREAAA